MDGDYAGGLHHDMHQDRHEGCDYQRIEVITGRRRRRNWTAEERARIVAESAAPGANISEVARRWGVHRGLLATWRRESGLTGVSRKARTSQALRFVPISITDAVGSGPQAAVPWADPVAAGPASGRIELEIDGNRMVVTGSADPAVVAVLVNALRGPR